MTKEGFHGPFVVLHNARTPQASSPRNVAIFSFGSSTSPSGVLVPIFTRQEEAKRYASSFGDYGKYLIPVILNGLAEIEKLLLNLEKNGVTHVDIDADRANPNPVPIGEFINRFRRGSE